MYDPRLVAVLSLRRHQMETFSALLAICAGNSPVSGEFPAQRPVTRSFDICFDLHPNKRLNKQQTTNGRRLDVSAVTDDATASYEPFS